MNCTRRQAPKAKSQQRLIDKLGIMTRDNQFEILAQILMVYRCMYLRCEGRRKKEPQIGGNYRAGCEGREGGRGGTERERRERAEAAAGNHVIGLKLL